MRVYPKLEPGNITAGQDGKPLVLSDYLSLIHIFSLKDMPGVSAKIVRLTPVNMVCHYTYEVNGLRGLDRVAYLRAALSGMSGSLNMSADSLPAGLSESLLFDGMVSRNQIIMYPGLVIN